MKVQAKPKKDEMALNSRKIAGTVRPTENFAGFSLKAEHFKVNSENQKLETRCCDFPFTLTFVLALSVSMPTQVSHVLGVDCKKQTFEVPHTNGSRLFGFHTEAQGI